MLICSLSQYFSKILLSLYHLQRPGAGYSGGVFKDPLYVCLFIGILACPVQGGRGLSGLLSFLFLFFLSRKENTFCNVAISLYSLIISILWASQALGEFSDFCALTGPGMVGKWTFRTPVARPQVRFPALAPTVAQLPSSLRRPSSCSLRQPSYLQVILGLGFISQLSILSSA